MWCGTNINEISTLLALQKVCTTLSAQQLCAQEKPIWSWRQMQETIRKQITVGAGFGFIIGALHSKRNQRDTSFAIHAKKHWTIDNHNKLENA